MSYKRGFIYYQKCPHWCKISNSNFATRQIANAYAFGFQDEKRVEVSKS